MSDIHFSDPDEDYEFTDDDIQSLLDPARLAGLADLRHAILRIAENPASFPYNYDPYRAVAIIDELQQGADTEVTADMPDDLRTLVLAAADASEPRQPTDSTGLPW